LVPLLFAFLLLLKWFRSVAWAGNSTVAVLVGVGAAVALVGTITGTLLPQIVAAPTESGLLGVVAALLTIAALLYFQFTAGQVDVAGAAVIPGWQRAISGLGRAVLMISFGALFAGVLSTSLVLLSDRLAFYIAELAEVLSPFLS
jgi:hypothetical protein